MAYILVESPSDNVSSSSGPTEIPHKPQKTALSRKELIEVVANILDNMIAEASQSYSEGNEVAVKTVFHASKKPAISIKDYLTRFGTYSDCHEDVFVYALIYLDKIGENVIDFELDSLNVHRVILLSLVTACKFYNDFYYKNKYYAQIGGVPLAEFNKLELEFLLNYVKFELYVESETFSAYYDDLISYSNPNEEKQAS